MKNVLEILKDLGIEVPDEKTADLNKAIAENYKTVAEVDKKVGKLEAEINSQKERADLAEESLKGFEGKDFDELTKQRDEAIENLKKFKEEKEAEIEAQAYADKISKAVEGLEATGQFYAESNRKSFVDALTAQKLPTKDDKLLGFDDFVKSYMETNPKDFITNEQLKAQGEAAQFTEPVKTGAGEGATPSKITNNLLF